VLRGAVGIEPVDPERVRKVINVAVLAGDHEPRRSQGDIGLAETAEHVLVPCLELGHRPETVAVGAAEDLGEADDRDL
jgi:hypothetical protein